MESPYDPNRPILPVLVDNFSPHSAADFLCDPCKSRECGTPNGVWHMAGDWIAMRHDLWECPQVVRIVSAMCPQNVRDMSERCRIVGALYRTWCLFDRFTEDGILQGYTTEILDEEIGISKWAENLQHVGWLIINEQSLTVPEFTEYFGDSAKRRMKDAKRKKEARNARPQCVRKMSTDLRTTVQDSTEENSTVKKKKNPPISPQGDSRMSSRKKHEYTEEFESFWKEYPSKGKSSKSTSFRAFKNAMRRVDYEPLMDAVREYAKSGVVVDKGIVKHASTWLNGDCWDDDRAAWKASGGTSGNGSGRTNEENIAYASKRCEEMKREMALEEERERQEFLAQGMEHEE